MKFDKFDIVALLLILICAIFTFFYKLKDTETETVSEHTMRIRIITSTLLLITAILGQAQNFEGTISGIKMNEKSYSDIVGQHFELKKSDNGKGTIEGIVAQIGKMPGTLHFAIPVTIGTDGKLATTKETEAGYMKMSFGPTKSLDTESFKGSVTDGKLRFELRVTSSMLGFTIADATMVFDGTK